MLTIDQIQTLYTKYSEILKLEVEEFGCKPTELRHLLGRLGEFKCALEVGGSLALKSNQRGFDVTGGNGRRISVKTTAQTTGFVTLNSNTLDQVDDLMLLQYAGGELNVIYYGPIEKAAQAARTWENNFELEISKAKLIA